MHGGWIRPWLRGTGSSEALKLSSSRDFCRSCCLVYFFYLFFLAERSQQLQTERGIKENKWAGAEREKPGYGRICQAPYRHVAIVQQPVIPGNGSGAQTGSWWW